MSFTNKIVVITGAGRGIGAATAVSFAKQGAKLVLIGRHKEKLEETLTKCNAVGNCDPLILVADLRKGDEVQSICGQIITKYGRIDVLVNSMATIENGSIESTNIEQYERVMNLNLRGAFQLTKLIARELTKTKGNIINVSSVAGLRPFSNVLVYAMSQAALDQFTRCIALELASKGVRCNSVHPSLVDTQIKIDEMDETTIEKFYEHAKRVHALGRLGTVDEVANVICFLASDLASFVTGASVPVDGGRHIMTAA